MSDRNFASGGRRFTGRNAPTATVQGLPDLKVALERVLPNEAKNILRRTTLDIARIASQRVKAKVPVKTGNLKRSIKPKRNRGTPTMVEATVTADRSGHPKSGRGYHSHLVEFGYTHKSGTFVPGQPYIVPTVEAMRPEVPELYRERFGLQLEKEMIKRAKRQKK